jgi:hypothetical protein
MTYSRDAAYNYARARWNTACHDNVISVIGAPGININQKWKELRLAGRREDWSVLFVPDPASPGNDAAAFVKGSETIIFQPWAGLGDCAHFMSNTLTAGGIEGLVTDFVPYLNGFLRSKVPFTKVLADEVTKERAQRVINKKLMKKGDVILYVAPPGGELGGGYVHSAMFTDDSKITCHSVARWNEDWKAPHDDNDFTFTLIHFAHDDTANPVLDGQVGGWWELTWNRDRYYYFFSSGRVSYTLQKPTTRVPPTFPKQRGYYYPQAINQVLLCWPGTGSLEELTLSIDGNSLDGKWNERDRLSATRMTF